VLARSPSSEPTKCQFFRPTGFPAQVSLGDIVRHGQAPFVEEALERFLLTDGVADGGGDGGLELRADQAGIPPALDALRALLAGHSRSLVCLHAGDSAVARPAPSRRRSPDGYPEEPSLTRTSPSPSTAASTSTPSSRRRALPKTAQAAVPLHHPPTCCSRKAQASAGPSARAPAQAPVARRHVRRRARA
jgi:hypothetical protein